jgi:hypothetical protein
VGIGVEDVGSSRTLTYAFAGGRFIARGSSVFRPRRWISSTESKPPPRRDGEDVEPIRMSSGAGPRAGFGVGFKMGAPAPFSLRRQKPPAVSGAAVENDPL